MVLEGLPNPDHGIRSARFYRGEQEADRESIQQSGDPCACRYWTAPKGLVHRRLANEPAGPLWERQRCSSLPVREVAVGLATTAAPGQDITSSATRVWYAARLIRPLEPLSAWYRVYGGLWSAAAIQVSGFASRLASKTFEFPASACRHAPRSHSIGGAQISPWCR